MPNQPDPDKTYLTVRIPRDMYEQLKKYAKGSKKTVSDVILSWIWDHVKDVSLTPEDYRRIADQVEKAIIKNKNK